MNLIRDQMCGFRARCVHKFFLEGSAELELEELPVELALLFWVLLVQQLVASGCFPLGLKFDCNLMELSSLQTPLFVA